MPRIKAPPAESAFAKTARLHRRAFPSGSPTLKGGVDPFLRGVAFPANRTGTGACPATSRVSRRPVGALREAPVSPARAVRERGRFANRPYTNNEYSAGVRHICLTPTEPSIRRVGFQAGGAFARNCRHSQNRRLRYRARDAGKGFFPGGLRRRRRRLSHGMG